MMEEKIMIDEDNKTPEKAVKVQLMMTDSALARLERLKRIIEAGGRADAVRFAVWVANSLADEIEVGGKLFFRTPDGDCIRLLVPYISKSA